MGAHRGSLDDVVNNPLELDLLRDFPWVLGLKLGPKSPFHSCSGLKLSVLENDEGRLLSREGRITSKAKAPYISSLKMVGFVHFSNFLFSQRNVTIYSLVGSPCSL